MVVKLYSTKWCTYCKMVRNFFQENKIKFKEINIQEDPKAAKEMLNKSGQTGVPITDINGKIVIGFNVEELTKHLKTKKQRGTSKTR
jgi:glutaredoxin 3